MNIVLIILLLSFLTIFVMMRRKTAKAQAPDEPEYSSQAPHGYIVVTQESTQPTSTPKSPESEAGTLVAKVCNIILGICFIFSLLALLLM